MVATAWCLCVYDGNLRVCQINAPSKIYQLSLSPISRTKCRLFFVACKISRKTNNFRRFDRKAIVKNDVNEFEGEKKGARLHANLIKFFGGIFLYFISFNYVCVCVCLILMPITDSTPVSWLVCSNYRYSHVCTYSLYLVLVSALYE